MGRKFRGEGVPSSTKSPGLSPTLMPSGALMHAVVLQPDLYKCVLWATVGVRYTSNKKTVAYGGHARCLPNVRTVTVKITTYNVEYLRLLKQNITVSEKWDRQYAAAVVLRDVKFDARIIMSPCAFTCNGETRNKIF